jgi:hypothetical protein
MRKGPARALLAAILNLLERIVALLAEFHAGTVADAVAKRPAEPAGAGLCIGGADHPGQREPWRLLAKRGGGARAAERSATSSRRCAGPLLAEPAMRGEARPSFLLPLKPLPARAMPDVGLERLGCKNRGCGRGSSCALFVTY